MAAGNSRDDTILSSAFAGGRACRAPSGASQLHIQSPELPRTLSRLMPPTYRHGDPASRPIKVCSSGDAHNRPPVKGDCAPPVRCRGRMGKVSPRSRWLLSFPWCFLYRVPYRHPFAACARYVISHLTVVICLRTSAPSCRACPRTGGARRDASGRRGDPQHDNLADNCRGTPRPTCLPCRNLGDNRRGAPRPTWLPSPRACGAWLECKRA